MTKPLTPEQVNQILSTPMRVFGPAILSVGGVAIGRVETFDIAVTSPITLEEAQRLATQIRYHYVLAFDGTITRTPLPWWQWWQGNT